jgi:hypothetical protein
MHSTIAMYQTEVQDRVNSYQWQAEPVQTEKPARGREAVASTRSWMSKQPVPQQHCC